MSPVGHAVVFPLALEEVTMANVSLRELTDCLYDASQRVAAAMDSAEEEPALDFESVRAPLREALKLLGEGSTGAADSVRGYGVRRGGRSSGNSESFYVDLDSIFRASHPYRNNANE